MSDGAQVIVGDDGVARQITAPEGTMETVGLKALQSVTEATVRQRARADILPTATNLRNGFLGNLVEGVASGIEGVAKEGFARIAEAGSKILTRLGVLEEHTASITDGQLALNNRQDLLSPLLDYASYFIPVEGKRVGRTRLQFSQQLGPSRGVQLVTMTDGGVAPKLLDKGLWDIRVHVVAQWVSVLATPNIEVRLRVVAPGGSVYSEQVAFEKTTNTTTLTIASSVVVPDAGYTVQVRVTEASSTRKILTGPAWSRLSIQHISRSVEGATGAEASETVDEQTDGGAA